MAVNFKPHEGTVTVCLGGRIITTEPLVTNTTDAEGGLEVTEVAGVAITGSIWKTESAGELPEGESDTAAAGADGGSG